MRNLLGITLQTKSSNVIQFSHFNSSKLLVEVLQRDIITYPIEEEWHLYLQWTRPSMVQ